MFNTLLDSNVFNLKLDFKQFKFSTYDVDNLVIGYIYSTNSSRQWRIDVWFNKTPWKGYLKLGLP